jgi:hypothetical protein
MRRVLWTLWTGTIVALTSGCATGPLLDNPLLLGPTASGNEPNHVYLPGGPDAYAKIFEKVLDVVTDYGFEIAETNRFDGRIETFPRIAPGVILFLKPGSPDLYERWRATLQTIRHRTSVLIQPADNGGFFVQVNVFKELEDLSRPVRATAGSAVFRNEMTVERQYVVVDPIVLESNWIPLGHDLDIEQLMLHRIAALPWAKIPPENCPPVAHP